MAGDVILQVRGVACGHGAEPLLSGIEVSVGAGGALSVVGPNGVGKSTLLRALAGQLPPQAGRVEVEGEDLASVSHQARARLVAMLPQTDRIEASLTVRELVELGRTPHLGTWGHMGKQDRQAVERAMDACRLTSLASRRLDRVSGGERQRARIAMTLAQEAPLLLLDEPVNHLDLRRRHQFFQLMDSLRQERRLALVCVLHDLPEAFREADHVLLLADGQGRVLDRDAQGLESTLAAAFDVPENWIPLLSQTS